MSRPCAPTTSRSRSNSTPAGPISPGSRPTLTAQAARNPPMDWDHKTGFVIRDLATQFTRAFDNVFTATSADAIPTPTVAPNANAFAPQLAERWSQPLPAHLPRPGPPTSRRQPHRRPCCSSLPPSLQQPALGDHLIITVVRETQAALGASRAGEVTNCLRPRLLGSGGHIAE